MQKLRRILALLGVILLVGMYLVTLVFALSANPNANNLLMASIVCTVIVPCLLYGMILVTRVLDNRHPDGKDETAEGNTPPAADKKKNARG